MGNPSEQINQIWSIVRSYRMEHNLGTHINSRKQF